MIEEYDFVASEIAELELLLQMCPKERRLDRLSLESRLRSVKALLETIPKPETKFTAQITFNGKPVNQSRGISADFAAKATGLFSEMFNLTLSGPLNKSGPIPQKAKKQLMITDIAKGSFGFKLELPMEEPGLFPENGEKKAMEQVITFLRASAMGSDDEVAEMVEGLSGRAVKKAHEFMEYLVQQQALCGLAFEESSFRFENSSQLQNAQARLNKDNLREENLECEGTFFGVLLDSMRFEFRLKDDGGVLRGKIAKDIEKPDDLNLIWCNKPASVKFRTIQVGRRPTLYQLMSMDDVRPLDPP